MTTRRDFVEAVLADPTDDLTRLVFADWLDENGEEARAEFIRVQIQKHGMLPDFAYGSHYRLLDNRERELFHAHADRWIWPLPTAFFPLDNLGVWSRGFPQMIATSVTGFACDIGEILENEPADNIRLHLLPPQRGYSDEALRLAKVAADPRLRFVTYLEVEGKNRLPVEWFAGLMASPHLTRLRRLWCDAVVGAAGVEALCDNPAISGLQHVTFLSAFAADTDCLDATTAACRIASCLHLAGLSYLEFRGCGLRAEAFEALLHSPYLSRMLKLDVWDRDWQPPAELAAALSGRFDRVSFV